MKRELRFPTILGLFLIAIGLVVTAFLVSSAQRFFLKASPDATPKEVKITNLFDTSFSVSFVTPDTPVSSAISYGEKSSLGSTATDDRVQAGTSQDRFTTHHLTVRFLKPGTKYYFKIISGGQQYDNQGIPYSVVTAPSLGTSTISSTPVYGKIFKSDKSPANGAIIYLTVKDSAPLSTLVKSSGSWLITLNNARKSDLSSYLNINPKGDAENIFVQGALDGVATAQTVTGNDAPVPTIFLGQTYNFSKGQDQNVLAQDTPTATPTATPSAPASSSGFLAGNTATTSAAIISPNQNSVLNDTKPTFSGVGTPGQAITITVHSDTVYSATIVVGQDGRWSWTPPGDLTPGQHSVTIASAGTNGQSNSTTTQNFTVLASGTQVTQSATPSAILSPTFTPTPTIAASASALPQSGTTLPTYLLLFFGVVIMIIGTAFYAAL